MYYTNAKDLYKTPLPKSRLKGSKLPSYGLGAWIGSNVGGINQFANLGAGAITSIDAMDGDLNPYASAGAGALKGAALGAKLGTVVPGLGNVVGAAGGAIIGGAAGLIKERMQQKQLDAAELEKIKLEEERRRSLEVANLQASKAILSTYPTSGVADAGFMLAMGGKIPTQGADYLAEGGEIIQHAVNDRPDTDANGDAKQINSNTSKFVGDSHDDPSEGIGVANDQEARIYSNRLYAPKDLVAQLKKL